MEQISSLSASCLSNTQKFLHISWTQKSKFIPSPQNSAPGPYLQSNESITHIIRRYRIKAIIMVQLDKWKTIISFTLRYMPSLVQCCYWTAYKLIISLSRRYITNSG